MATDNNMIQSLYEICQKEHESMEEYMLRVHQGSSGSDTCAYPVPGAKLKGKSMRREQFYYGLIPSLRDMHSVSCEG